MKKFCLPALCLLVLLPYSCAEDVYLQVNREDDRYKNGTKYDHIYMDPPRTSLYSRGRYIYASSGVRYVHSPSKHKREAHAARINAYNHQLGNY